MALTLTNYGTFAVSGAALKTCVDAMTTVGAYTSGAGLYFIPVGNGQQINLIRVQSS